MMIYNNIHMDQQPHNRDVFMPHWLDNETNGAVICRCMLWNCTMQFQPLHSATATALMKGRDLTGQHASQRGSYTGGSGMPYAPTSTKHGSCGSYVPCAPCSHCARSGRLQRVHIRAIEKFLVHTRYEGVEEMGGSWYVPSVLVM